MNLSEKWLREWVNPLITITQLCNQLTQAGLETEIIKGTCVDFKNIVVGEIIDIQKCACNTLYYIFKMRVGKNFFLNVISKKISYSRGSKVAIGTLESELSRGKQIRAANLKGINSEGFFCSYRDLNIFPYDDTIIQFSQETLVGIDILNTHLFNDTLIKVNTVLNRLNEINILGIAREVSILNNLKIPVFSVKSPIINSKKISTVNIDLEYNNCCYLGRVIQNVDLKMPTPFWIRDKLRRCHILSKNMIIDILNYIRIELGESLHILDLQTIDDQIIIRSSKLTELVTLFNCKKVCLKKETVIVSDKSKILILGNNVNTKESFINKHTKDLFIGSLYLSPLSSGKYTKKNNVDETVIDYFQYNVNLTLQRKAIDYATNLILDIYGGRSGPIINKSKIFNSKETLPCKIILKHKNVNRIVGDLVPYNIISKILLKLGYNIIEHSDKWIVFPPDWRLDILIEEDVIADFIRIYGYSNIRQTVLKGSYEVIQESIVNNSLKKIKYMLINKGYNEIITYSFVDPKLQKLINPSIESLLLLSNPVSNEMSSMRVSLWTGLLTTILYNQNRQQERLRFFESGLCFFCDDSKELKVSQELILAGAISGFCYDKTWNLPYRKVDFYDLKGDVESIIELYTDLNNVKFSIKQNFSLHPGQSADIYVSNKNIGKIGVLHPVLEKKLNLKYSVILFELFLEKLLTETNVKLIRRISDFPSVKRDISIILPVAVTFHQIITECRKIFSNNTSEINVFDVYSGNKIEKGKKSVAISFVFQDLNKTLNDNQIDAMLKICIKKLEDSFQAILRN